MAKITNLNEELAKFFKEFAVSCVWFSIGICENPYCISCGDLTDWNSDYGRKIDTQYTEKLHDVLKTAREEMKKEFNWKGPEGGGLNV